MEAVSPKALGAYKLQKYEMMINGISIYEDALQVCTHWKLVVRTTIGVCIGMNWYYWY